MKKNYLILTFLFFHTTLINSTCPLISLFNSCLGALYNKKIKTQKYEEISLKRSETEKGSLNKGYKIQTTRKSSHNTSRNIDEGLWFKYDKEQY